MRPMDLFAADKRWLDRRERWVKPERALFDARYFAVDVIPESMAKAFICAHHYSGSFPAARLSVGQFCGAHLVGVATFSVGMPGAILKHTGFAGNAGVELGRFVCLPSVAYNGETWFLARAFRALRAEKTEVRAVVSYADPMERRTAAGLLTKPAHAGTIYQASNATFVGRARGGPIHLTAEGQIISRRVLTKIAGEESGSGYCARLLIAAGADERRHGEAPRDWLARVLIAPTFRKLQHPGNLTYTFGLDRAAKALGADRAQPYPVLKAA